MAKFKLGAERASKIQGTDRIASKLAEGDEMLELIIKVNEADYVPDGITVRASIDAYLFTAEAPRRELERLEADPKVESVSVGKPLRVIE